MLRKLPFASLAAFVLGRSNTAPKDVTQDERWKDTSFFDLEVRTLEGREQKLTDFRGKVVLVVNTASKCGLTPQLEGLQTLHERYAERGLVILGFPSNQFMGQEPGTPEEIASFCQRNYGVAFPMMEKVEVQAGSGQSQVYGLLGARTGQLPDWNFAKYLIARDGRVVRFFGARTEPLGAELTEAIEALLEEEEPATGA
jgi:glutathione peroxidase